MADFKTKAEKEAEAEQYWEENFFFVRRDEFDFMLEFIKSTPATAGDFEKLPMTTAGKIEPTKNWIFNQFLAALESRIKDAPEDKFEVVQDGARGSFNVRQSSTGAGRMQSAVGWLLYGNGNSAEVAKLTNEQAFAKLMEIARDADKSPRGAKLNLSSGAYRRGISMVR